MRAPTVTPTLVRLDERSAAMESLSTLRRPGAVGIGATIAAVLLGVASAGISLFWALGGHALIDTMGGSTERWGRDRSVLGIVALVGWAVVKLAVAAATVVAVGAVGERPPTRWLRAASWLVATQLAVYGGLLTIGGLLVQTRLVDPADTADRHAITWHALLWDPWTALWGVALAIALWCTRPASRSTARPAAAGAHRPTG